MDPIYGLPPVFRGPSYMALPSAGEVNWGMKVFQVEHLRSITDGTGMKVGGVDTGVDRSHPLLANVKSAKDFTGSRVGSDDPNGHGTHISGTICAMDPRIGVGPGFEFHHAKGLGDNGSGGSGLLDGIEHCASLGCKVISSSWGGGGRWPDWEKQAQRLADGGIWQVYAGGNSGPNTPDTDHPGRSLLVINSAALNLDLTPANFSSAGDKIDTSGPGVNIMSTKPGGGFQSMSGTSMACPFVAAVLALYRRALELAAQPIPHVFDLRKQLMSDSTDTGAPGDDRRTGPGWVTPILLAMNLVPDPPPIQQ